jgi:RNA polymerase sigma factor (sigma-70 family)
MRIDAVLGCRDDLLPAALLRLASDQRLVDQVRVGSERAFEALFDRHHRPVLAFCRHMLGSREEAEDVVQLTFLAAYRDLGRGERPAALRPWLYGIARHRCLSVLRARREHPVGEVTLPATDRLAAEVATREDLRAVLANVAHLPEDQRAALVLAELGDVSHDEIARILGCPREGSRRWSSKLAPRSSPAASLARHHAPTSASSSPRFAEALCGARRCAATCTIARRAARSASRSASSGAHCESCFRSPRGSGSSG